MGALLTWLRSLGGNGAAANAAEVIAEHRREEWLIEGLVMRLERSARNDLAQPTTSPALGRSRPSPAAHAAG